MNKRKVIAAVLGIILILGAGYLLMQFFAGQKKLPQQRPRPEAVNYVKVNTVKYENIDTEIVAFGRITSAQPIDVIAEVGGRLLPGSIPLKEGQNFRRGQVLCRIYNAEARLNLQSRKSQFLNLLATALPDVKIDYADKYDAWLQYFESIDMDKPLPEIPEIKDLKLKTFLATKNILSEYYSIRSGEENLRKYTIYAPYNGSFAEVNLEMGTIVNPGGNIARIIRTDELELEVPIEVKDIRWVSEGAEVQVFSDEENRSWEGTVIRIGDLVDPNTQSINVYIRVNPGDNTHLYDGLYLKAVIPGSTLESALEVPRNILQNDDEVFVVEKGLLRTKKVNIEKVSNDNVLINGLNEGDSLVIDAPVNASENMKVQIFDEKKSQGASQNKKPVAGSE